jgi:hypothetical protein
LLSVAGVFTAVAVITMPTPGIALVSLLVAGLVLASAWGWGSALLRLWPSVEEAFTGAARSAVATLVGLAAQAGAVFAAAVVGALTVTVAVLVVGGGILLAFVRAARGHQRPVRSRGAGRLEWLAFGLGIAPVFVLGLLASLPPPTFFDSLEYHLAIPADYVMSGTLAAMPDNFFSHLPHATEMLDVLIMLLGRNLRVAPLHWGVGIIAALLLAHLARRHFHPSAGALAVAIFFGCQEAALSLYAEGVDLPFTACSLVAIDLFLTSRDRPRVLAAAFFFAGLATSFKVQGVLVVAALGLATLVLRRSHLRGRAGRRLAVRAALLAALPVLPWAIVNVVRHGNPGYPFLGALFGQPSGNGRWLAWILAYTRSMGIDGGNLARLPGALTGMLFQPAAWNPLPLAAVLAFWPARRRVPRREGALVAAVLLVGWAAAATVFRYGMPAFAVVSALAAAGIYSLLGELRARVWRRAAAGATMAVLLVSTAHMAIAFVQARDFVPYLLGAENDVAYQERVVPYSPASVFAVANRTLPADARVLSFDEPRVYGLWRPVRAASIFDRRVLESFLRGGDAGSPAEVASRIRAAGFDYVLVNAEYFDDQARKMGNPYRYTAAERELIDRILADDAERVVGQARGPAIYKLDAVRRAVGAAERRR